MLKDTRYRILFRNFAIELLVYSVLVVGYFLAALQLLGQPLKRLYVGSLPLYAIVALLLIVAQGVLLEAVTSFIVGRLGLDRWE